MKIFLRNVEISKKRATSKRFWVKILQYKPLLETYILYLTQNEELLVINSSSYKYVEEIVYTAIYNKIFNKFNYKFLSDDSKV